MAGSVGRVLPSSAQTRSTSAQTRSIGTLLRDRSVCEIIKLRSSVPDRIDHVAGHFSFRKSSVRELAPDSSKRMSSACRFAGQEQNFSLYSSPCKDTFLSH